MKQRCNDSSHPNYKNYGERGIKICERWMNFENFYADMGEPEKGMSLERKNNDMGYSLENCMWIPYYLQQKNRRNTIFIEYKGKKKCVLEWAKELNIPYHTLLARIKKNNWPMELIFKSAPNQFHKRRSGGKGIRKIGNKYFARITIDGKSKSLGGFFTPELAHAAYKHYAELSEQSKIDSIKF